MKTANFSEFRRHAAEYLDGVENGEMLRILRHGKPVADITPVAKETPAWKKPASPLTLPGISLSRIILENRRKSSR